MSEIIQEPSSFARAEATRVMEAIMDRRAPDRSGGPVVVALLHQRRMGIDLDESAWQRMERAAARLFHREATRPDGSEMSDVDRARVLVTDTAIQRVAKQRIAEVEAGQVAGARSNVSDPDIRHLADLREFSSLAYLTDREALRSLAEGRFHEAPDQLAGEVQRQIDRSAKPVSSATEASLKHFSGSYASAVIAQARGLLLASPAKDGQAIAPAMQKAEDRRDLVVPEVISKAPSLRPNVVEKPREPRENVLERLSRGPSPYGEQAREEYERAMAMASRRRGSSVDILC